MIKKLNIKNFIGIEELNLIPGKVNIIAGENGQGKSSILEGLETLFTNQNRRPQVIRDGADQAILLAELDDGITVRRGITDKGANLSVIKEGFKAQSPQKLLSSMVGAFAFNPVDFLLKDEKEQTRILLEAVKIEVTQAELEAWTGEKVSVDTSRHGLQVCQEVHRYFYDRRREANARVKALEGEVSAFKVPEDFNPEVYRNISLKEKYDDLRAAQETNEAIKEAASELTAIAREKEAVEEKAKLAEEKVRREADNRRTEIDREIADLQARIKALEVEKDAINTGMNQKIADIGEHRSNLLAALLERKKKAEETLEVIKPVDLAPLEKAITEFEEKKALVRDFDLREETKRRLEAVKAEAARLDGIVKTLAAKPGELIAKASLPIEGLGIDEAGNVTIHGRPIKSLSTSEQIQLSLDIARATAGPLKIICVDGLEQLSRKNRELLLVEAVKDDYQYFVTMVQDDKDLEIFSV